MPLVALLCGLSERSLAYSVFFTLEMQPAGHGLLQQLYGWVFGKLQLPGFASIENSWVRNCSISR